MTNVKDQTRHLDNTKSRVLINAIHWALDELNEMKTITTKKGILQNFT